MKRYEFKLWEKCEVYARSEDEARSMLESGDYERLEIFGEDLEHVGGEVE